MAQLGIFNLDNELFKASGQNGSFRIVTDLAIPDPAPADFKIELQIDEGIPDVDFSIDGFVWTHVAGVQYTGYKIIEYTDLAPATSLIFFVVPLANSQIGDNPNFNITLINPSGLYTVDAANDDVIQTIKGNPSNLSLMPPVLEKNNAIKSNNSNWLYATLHNTTGGDLIVTDFDCPDDEGGGKFTYFVDSGSNTWNSFISGSSAVTISTGSSLKVLVKFQLDDAVDLSAYYLYVGYKTTGATPTLYESAWMFGGDTVVPTLAACGSACRDVDIQSFTWLDGTTVGPFNNCPASIDLGSIAATDLSQAYADVVLRITNNCTHSCGNVGSAGDIRLGDLESGWYSIFDDDDNGKITIQTAVPIVDTGYTIANGAYKDLTLRIAVDKTLGSHNLDLKALTLDCLEAAIVVPNTRVNSGVVATNSAIKRAAYQAGTDLNLVSLISDIQGGASIFVNDTSNYNYAAKGVAALSLTGYVYRCGYTRTEYFTVHYSFSDAFAASERDFSYYINGTQVGVISTNVNAHAGRFYVAIAMNTGDIFSLGVYTDNSENMGESISVTVSEVDQAAPPEICNACDVSMQWNVVDSDIDNYPVAPTKSSTVGVQDTLRITLTNNGNYTETITAVTIGATIAADLSLYFPSSVSIGPGLSHDFDFSFTPSSVYTDKTDNVTFTQSIAGDHVVAVALTGVAQSTTCAIAPVQTAYSYDVNIDVQKAVKNIAFETLTNSGTLKVTRTTSEISFPSGLADVSGASLTQTYGLASYEVAVNTDSIVNIPMAILETSPCPSPAVTSTSLTWVLYNDQNESICNGSIPITINITCLEEATSCPSFFQQTNVIEENLVPDDTGSITVDIQLSQLASVTGAQRYSFVLPAGETTLSWNATQQVAAGLTWDISGIAGSPPTLDLVVAITYAGTDFEIKLDYTIATDEITRDHESTVSMDVTYINTAYVCTTQISYLTLSITSDATSGGFAAAFSTTVNELCATLNLVDGSNYTGSVSNHELANFDVYREIVLINPAGTEYLYSSLTDAGDEDIGAASGNVFVFSGDIGTGGIYKITLYTVPTHAPAGTYNINDCVVVGTAASVAFYKSLQDSNSTDPGDSGWEDWWELLDDRDDLTDAYKEEILYAQMCEITQIRLDLEESLYCSGVSQCDEDCWCEGVYNQIRAYERMVTGAINYTWYTKAVVLYDYAKTLADKSTNC